MTWRTLIKTLREHGFDGNEKDLESVKAYLDEHFDGNVKLGDEVVDVEKAHAEAHPPKPDLDLTKQAAEDHITASIKEGIADAKDALGLNKPAPDSENKAHDIEVKVRLADHPTAGYEAPTKAAAIGQFLTDAKNAGQGEGSEKLEAWRKASLSTYGREGVGADGGFAVPEEMRTAIESAVEGEESLLSRCDTFPMSSQSVTMPYDDTTVWGSSGVQGYWEGEAGALTQSKPVLKEKRWTARKVTALVPVTDELAADAPAMGAYVNRKVGEVLDFKIGEAIIRGTGSGQPLGVLNGGGTVSVAKEGSQVAATFIGINAIKMMSRLAPQFRASAVWLTNPDVDPYLYRLASPGLDAIGSETSSWGTALYMPASGLNGGIPSLLGRPVIPTQHCAQLGTVGDVILGSFAKGYGVGIRGGLDAQTSIHFWFDQAATAFRFIMRMDGQPHLNAAISPRAGSNTMSAFVTTASRS